MIKKTVVIAGLLLSASAFAGVQEYSCPPSLYCGMGAQGDPTKYGCENLDPQWEILHIPVMNYPHAQIDYFVVGNVAWSSTPGGAFNSTRCNYFSQAGRGNDAYLSLDIAPGKPKYIPNPDKSPTNGWTMYNNNTQASCGFSNTKPVFCTLQEAPGEAK